MATVGYVTDTELTAYATARGITLNETLTVLLTKSLDYIETRNYSGYKTDEEQALQFPRNGDTEVPTDIKNAQMVGAILIDGGAELQGTLGQSVKRKKLATMEIEYQDGTTSQSTFTALDDILGKYMISGCKVVRA